MAATDKYRAPEGLTVEQFWEMFYAKIAENEERDKEYERKRAEEKAEYERKRAEEKAEYDRKWAGMVENWERADRRIQEANRQLGGISNTFGEVIEHLVLPGIEERFAEMGLRFSQVSPRRKLKDSAGMVVAEIDLLLENKDTVLAVETKGTTDQINETAYDARMKTQMTFSDVEYAGRKRISRRETFLRKMDALIPWAEPVAVIRPCHYAGKRGRPPRGIESMLRMYFLQLWYNLSDEMTEESVYDSRAMKEIDFDEEDAPDATTLPQFRHLPERNRLQEKPFERINAVLEREGLIRHGGSVIDATIIEAPCSTKNTGKSRDPEMAHAKKGNQWHFGMKAHVGADAGTGMVHTVEITAANVSDVTEGAKPVRPDDEFVNADAGYVGIEKRAEVTGDERLSRIDWRISPRPGKARAPDAKLYGEVMDHLRWVGQPRWDTFAAYLMSKVRSKVEHGFYIVKH